MIDAPRLEIDRRKRRGASTRGAETAGEARSIGRVIEADAE
jgi:hypothetical protein